MAAYEAPGRSDDWFTPGYIFEALGERFDLDVAAPVEGPRYVPADRWLWENGATAPWHGFIWMNPPFGHMKTKRIWLDRFFAHPGGGIALCPDRTSAPWWHEFAPKASAILFMNGKVKFERPDGSIGKSPGTGTALLANGERAKAALLRSGLGHVMVSAWRHDEDQAGRALQGGHDDVSLVDEAALLVERPPEPLAGDLRRTAENAVASARPMVEPILEADGVA